jgi:peptidoglycan/LPS O-acetylase OafA/YrhL
MEFVLKQDGARSVRDQPVVSPAFSVFLDLLRFVAALLVVVGHLTQPYFSKGWPNLTGMAFSMVAVFFVLSGFVIRYAVDKKPGSASSYFISRFARVYSVLVPAVILTVLLDTFTRYMHPDFYNFRFYDATTNLGWRVLAVLFFVNQSYGHDIALMSNSPIWSMGYEVPYYIVFGLFFYIASPWRWLLIGLFALFLGPNIFVLFPLWLSGCWLYLRLKKCRQSAACGLVALLLLLATGAWWLTAPPLIIVLPEQWQWLEWIWRGRSSQFPSFYIAGVLTLLGIVSVWHLQGILTRLLIGVSKPVKWLAGGSFSLYLYHFPLLVMVRAMAPYDKTDALAKIAVFGFVVICSYILAQYTERRKDCWARGFIALWRIMVNKCGNRPLFK